MIVLTYLAITYDKWGGATLVLIIDFNQTKFYIYNNIHHA